MDTSSENMLRVVIIKDCDQFVAQCLEVDLCVHAPTLDLLEARLDALIEAEREYAQSKGKKLADIGPAPKAFFDMWDKGRQVESRRPELKLAAA